jgi:hypothetical protein
VRYGSALGPAHRDRGGRGPERPAGGAIWVRSWIVQCDANHQRYLPLTHMSEPDIRPVDQPRRSAEKHRVMQAGYALVLTITPYRQQAPQLGRTATISTTLVRDQAPATENRRIAKICSLISYSYGLNGYGSVIACGAGVVAAGALDPDDKCMGNLTRQERLLPLRTACIRDKSRRNTDNWRSSNAYIPLHLTASSVYHATGRPGTGPAFFVPAS